MFPPVSRQSIVSDDLNPFTQAYRGAVIYDGPDADDALYEGPIIVHANGWLELEGNRLLSPAAVHHVDIYDEGDAPGTANGEIRDGGDDEPDGDDRRTGRFSPW